jgi:Neutral/alkaline non-lysosomal ceramidase, N-terminal
MNNEAQVNAAIIVRILISVGASISLACASAGPVRTPPWPGGMLVGVAQIDITPPEPIRLTGYGSRSTPSERIGQRLRAKALAFGGNRERPAVLITADLIGISWRVTQEVARRLQQARIERGQFAISTTHTHTGPMLAGTLPYIFSVPVTADQQVVIDRYSADLVDKLERVALAALADRRPSRVAWGRGTASFAANRRVLKEGKWIAFGIAPEGPVDRDLPVLTVRSDEGALRAVLVSYACHATTLEGRDNFIHGDWPGVAQELIEKRHPGVVAMVAIGTGADANPNPRGGGLADVEQHAGEVADEVDRLLTGTLHAITAPPVGQVRSLSLALAPLPRRADWEQQATQKGANGIFARAMLEQLDRGERLETSVSYPVQTWTFAKDLAMVFLGGEVVAEYGLRLKRELDGSRLWVHAYSNDVQFYVPSKRMIPEGGYEVVGSMVYYGHPAPLAEATEDEIVRAVHELLPAFGRRSTDNSRRQRGP